MAKRTSIALLFLICLSSFLFHALSSNPATHTAAVNNGDVKSANDNKELNSAGKEVDCFFGLPILWPIVHPPLPSSGSLPKFHWPFVHPPLPANFPKIQWPFVHPPLPADGFKWPPHLPFPHPPLPAGGFKWPPHLPFPLPPLPAGDFKWPPHLPFVLPPMPAGSFKLPPNWPFVHAPLPSHWWPHGYGSDDETTARAAVVPPHKT